jgi:hypothetical protein
MDPITIAAIGTMAVSGLVQLYNSERARGASKARLAQIEAMYNKIIPPDYDLRIQDPPQLHEETLKQPEFSGSMAAPKFNLEKLTPDQFKQVGQMVPEVAPLIKEVAPQTLQRTDDMNLGRDAQLNALRKFMDIGGGEFDPQYQEAVQRAARQSQTQAQSREESILQDFARRGQGGSGLSLAAQLGASRQAMDSGAMANLSAASEAYRNRLNALSQGAQLGGQISAQDLSMQERNADIINAFNQRMSQTAQAQANQRANVLNQAQQYNLGVSQDLANRNTSNANEFSLQNQQRLDNLAKYGYDVAAKERARLDDLNQQKYQNTVNERNYQNQMALSKYNINSGEIDRLNKLRQQMFENEMNKSNAKAGIGSQFNAMDIGAAQDRNAAIQGLSNIAGLYAQQSSANNRAQADRTRQADLANYQQTGNWMTDDQMDDYKKRQQSYGY